MFWKTTKIIEALATIKADTANHKENLQEFKDSFGTHVAREDKQTGDIYSKIEGIHASLKELQCPHEDRISNVERRVVDIGSTTETRRLSDVEAKAKELKDRSDLDKSFSDNISALQARSKYNLISTGAIWTIIAVMLRKLFI